MKKYNIGYMAGVYDLFHVGHLNMIKRAKENCNYLIVGVLVDELVVYFKKKLPFIPFEERIEIIRSIKGVDEAVPVTFENSDKLDAWNLYRFDCQFSGSDYAGVPGWLYDKERLEKVGSTIEFFPYTESTSSTYIKKLIGREISGKKLFLFGSGRIGQRFLRFLKDSKEGDKWNVVGFLDNDMDKHMTLIERTLVFQPDYLSTFSDYDCITVVITTKEEGEIREQLKKMGIRNIVSYYEFSGYTE
jgi:cytidyltransferase-related domain